MRPLGSISFRIITRRMTELRWLASGFIQRLAVLDCTVRHSHRSLPLLLPTGGPLRSFTMFSVAE